MAISVNIKCLKKKGNRRIAANPVFHNRIKHFELDLHFLREKVSEGVIEPEKIESHCQIADGFTKGLSVEQHSLL